MRCDTVREALSAQLDGEDPPFAADELDHHLAACSSCSAWAGQLAVLHRMVRVREAEPVPDLTTAILGTDSVRRRSWLGREVVSAARWALLVVALTQLVLAAPALFLGADAGTAVHVARELGGFDVALAVGLLLAACQPQRAWGLLPVMTALGFVMAGTAVLDLVRGATTGGSEAHHLLDLAGLLLLWRVAQEAATPSRRRTGIALS